MSSRSNQHFVPQFYFKLFTAGSRHIHLLHKKDESFLLNTGIKGQCAEHGFYGSAKIESMFSHLEAQHSIVLKQIRDMAWSESPSPLESLNLAHLWQAVVFQWARTKLVIEKTNPAAESLRLELFKEYLKRSPGIENREAVIELIESGQIRITEEPQAVIARSIDSALQCAVLISDLDFHLLRNRTDYPFLFGDSPVVFCNTYYRNVAHRGVLGYQTPGLQIFFPLDSRTLLMLIDDQVYTGRYRDPFIIDVDRRSDVSQLNALQMHHSLNAVYFADLRDQAYVTDLWNAHKESIVMPRSRLQNRRGWLIDGQRVDDAIYHTFESHLNIRLALSFIECEPIHPARYVFRRRSPELVQEHKERMGRQTDRTV